MIWDFRSLIRRGLGQWPRTWREEDRRPIRPPLEPKAEDKSPRTGDGGSPTSPEATARRTDQIAEERWLPPPWEAPKDSGDGWKKAD